jgi:hypothetical protein
MELLVLAGYTKRKEEKVMPKKPEGMDQDTYEGGENEASSYPDMPDDMGPEPEPEPKAKPKSPKKMAKGGRVGGRGDGCCTKGKTKGRYV